MGTCGQMGISMTGPLGFPGELDTREKKTGVEDDLKVLV